MASTNYKELLEAGVHFGHLTRKWDPKMAPYIFMEKNGIHIIDLNKTLVALDEATSAIKNIAKSGRKIMFVATKKQAQDIVAEEAKRLKMPYVTDRWLGGMLTNFATVRKSLKKMSTIDKMMKDNTAYAAIAKREKLMLSREREKLMLSREREKLERVLGGIADLSRLPAALFIVDVKREHIAVKEAHKLNLPVFAICDTNSNPELVDFPIPANDDASKSISLIVSIMGKAIEEGLSERKVDKEETERKRSEEEGIKAKQEADEQ
ncbi:30S ribosomal protein S2 [Pontibacter sp. KCTC 32443]|uniref:30S ribosomal protein S2 n=1 Tax=Pontibacter sp. KCTC 32443 TaxID=2764721 RepID=UPI00164EBB04|nr:30S ribosomal protein S2 [Pontibacter sp. KCTC 32443]MBC5774038.1 30S ribosomal protein S2 [Pontibacter sp. KCTC 32443]